MIAVSEFTKRELVDLLGVAEERIHVVPNGVEAPFVPDGPRAEGDYVLAVGTLEPRKNLPRLVEATRRAGLELRIVGARGWGDVDVSAGDDVRSASCRTTSLRASTAARCASRTRRSTKGSGFRCSRRSHAARPSSRARAARWRRSPHAAVLVDPRDTDAIAAGIAEAIARRDELATLGPERARRYSWDASAEATAAVYKELA